MALDPASDTQGANPETGLRGRKKAKRRQEILHAAAKRFARDGVDATTIAEIANECGVSPPTVFNYFGSKENILSALIFEGTERERMQHSKSPRKTNCSFGEVLGDFMCECSQNTMRIAGKRVWRYAEAANIRRPNSEFEKRFSYSDAELCRLISQFLGDYDIRLRNHQTPDYDLLGKLFFDRWTALYFQYIKDDTMSLAAHTDAIRTDVDDMISLLFQDEFATTSPLKQKEARK